MTGKAPRLIHPPWTPEQVYALNAFQRRGGVHPLTCGGEHTPGSPALIAYTDGWRCPQPYGESCDYRQDWAHAFMADPGASAGLVAVPPTTALRDRIADAIRALNEGGTLADLDEEADVLAIADAVLGVLPAGSGDTAATRAAVLRDLIVKAEDWDGHITVQELRRLAAETQPKIDDIDLTEADIDRMMAAGVPVQIVTAPPAVRPAERDATRVIALYEQWVKTGAPPLGVSISRWWDKRLIELHHAIFPSRDSRGTGEEDS